MTAIDALNDQIVRKRRKIELADTKIAKLLKIGRKDETQMSQYIDEVEEMKRDLERMEAIYQNLKTRLKIYS